MTKHTKVISPGVCLSVLIAAMTAPHAVASDDTGDFKKIIDMHAEAVVTIQFINKVQSPDGNEEEEVEIPGVIVDADGLVLCVNSQLFPLTVFRQFIPPDVTSEPTQLKIIMGADDDEYDADLVARDGDLDLAWVRIKDMEGASLSAVDFTKGSAPKIGQKLLSVHRMNKFFNRAPFIRAGRICGETDSPRQLYIGNSELAAAVGLPVFDTAGRATGMVVMQLPDEDEIDASAGMGGLGAMKAMRDMFNGVILPAKRVAKATKRVQTAYPREEKASTDGAPGG